MIPRRRPTMSAAPRNSSLVLHKGYEISREILDAIVSDNQRVLWAFIKRDGQIMAVPYDESRVIWLQDSDLERANGEV
jgi:hypothetical protein